jgi:hypothetical protein
MNRIEKPTKNPTIKPGKNKPIQREEDFETEIQEDPDRHDTGRVSDPDQVERIQISEPPPFGN